MSKITSIYAIGPTIHAPADFDNALANSRALQYDVGASAMLRSRGQDKSCHIGGTMSHTKTHITFWIVVTILCVGSMTARPVLGAETVTLKSLLEEMVDRDVIAQLPDPAYTCKQASSYDRHSTDPGLATWWANMDRSYFVRVEENNGRKEHVLMDEKGPGVIVRFWATWHGPGGGPFSNGILRFYLDGQEKPAIEGHAAEIISRGGLVGPPLSEGVSPLTQYAHRGHNLYLPIPYAQSCKITYEADVLVDDGGYKGEALYYQINYRTYQDGTQVDSFSMQKLKEAKSVVDRVQKMLSDNAREDAGSQELGRLKGLILPSQHKSVTIEGSKAIRCLKFKLDADDLVQALRSTIIKIAFDGETAVWAPIGDFFGTGYHIRPYATWYTDVTEDGTMACYWVMPFAKEAEVTIMNLGGQAIELHEGTIAGDPWDWDDSSCHFHATWKQWARIMTQSNEKPADHGAMDMNWLTAQGQGQYVGDVLTLFNTANAWWGEGDEKIFVDGETFPSHIGTGTEDYFGYAWCRPEYFASAFHAQPSGDGNFVPGFTVNLRFRALDAIPFTESIQFDMELWHWAKTPIDYAPTTLWYARPGATCDVKCDYEEAKRRVPRSVEDIIKPRRVEGAIEGEVVEVTRCTGGTTEKQRSTSFGWSGNHQLWWKDGGEGSRLVVQFEMEEAGTYDVTLGITKAVDYGIVRVSVNGQTKLARLDGYNTSVIAEDVKLGSCQLNKGKNTLEVTILGSNPKAARKYMFGLDYILPTK